MLKENLSELQNLYKRYFDTNHFQTERILNSASDRQYYRFGNNGQTVIGVYNSDIRENRAFLEFTRHFRKLGLPVPEIITVSSDETCYLQEDLGNLQLRDKIRSVSSEEKLILMKQALLHLAEFQFLSISGFPAEYCYPVPEFNRTAIFWDLNYFKYNFLKLTELPFDENRLEEDFRVIAANLGELKNSVFVFRDFQPRNIMYCEDSIQKMKFIDYQGGRMGSCYYDVACFLYSSSSDLNQPERATLLDFYRSELEKYMRVPANFDHTFYQFVCLRSLQVLGAYGFRGLWQKKINFLQSIPQAVRNLQWLRDNTGVFSAIPEISGLIDRFEESDHLKPFFHFKARNELTILVQSFSYIRGLPVDTEGHGGGFAFDCRCLPNPGRLPEYKQMNGTNGPVQKFLKSQPQTSEFLQHCHHLIATAAEVYQSRNMNSLTVNFGCTGGQHRSVYCAEKTAEYFRLKKIPVILNHYEMKRQGLL